MKALCERAPISFQAILEVRKHLAFGQFPVPGQGLDDQPRWFKDTVDWLARWGILEAPIAGGF